MSAHDGADPRSGEARRRRLVALIGDGGSASPSPGLRLRARLQRLCAVSLTTVGVDGAGVTVMGSADAGMAGHRDQLAATGPLTRRLEDLQFTAGEGPCLDAYAFGVPVLAGDVASEKARWLGFATEALAAGAAAVFSLPLHVGAVRLGTLDLYRGSAGRLSSAELADALILAALATEALLELAAGPGPRVDPATGQDAADREPRMDAGWLPDVHAEVHVASGMVSAREGIDVGAALLRIRAFAFSSGESVGDVARRIVDRDLVLDHTGTTHRTDTDTDLDGPPAPNASGEDDD